MREFFTAKRLAKLGIFAALTTVLYFLRFPLPFFPSFLQLNLSDLPLLICGFAMGPMSAFIVLVVKILIGLPFTHTMCVGELADFIIGAALVIPSSLYYKRDKTKKGAIISMAIGTLSSTLFAMLANVTIILPFYLKVMGWSLGDLVGACQAIIPFITESNFYVVYTFVSVLPFNLLRCLVAGLVTYFVYKHISNLLKKFE